MDVTCWIDEEDGMLYKSVQNDGQTFLRHGPEEKITCLGPAYEAISKHPRDLERALRIRYYAICEQTKTL